MISCLIYFENKIEDESLMLLWVENYLEKLIKSNLLQDLFIMNNDFSVQCLKILKKLNEKYTNIKINIIKKFEEKINYQKLIENYDIIICNKKENYNVFDFSTFYTDLLIYANKKKKQYINVNVFKYLFSKFLI